MRVSELEKTINDTNEVHISEAYSSMDLKYRFSLKVVDMMKYIYPVFISVVFLCSNNVYSQSIIVKENPKKLGDSINSQAEEIQPLLSKDGTLYFVRTFHEENLGGKTGGQDIWFTTKGDSSLWLEATNLLDLNNADNNAVVGIGQNDSILYLLNSYSNISRRRFGIWSSKKHEDDWSKPKEFGLEFFSESDFRGYYVAPHEDVILFSSDQSNSIGGEDIYMYHKVEDEWVGPLHLGEGVNTEEDEISPFITEDHKTLFFSSKGRSGHGGFDIYASERIGESWEDWSIAKNLGPIINSSGFDGYFSTYDDGNSFYASDKGGISTDIYSTEIDIIKLGIKSDTLAYGEYVRSIFKEALLRDTTLHSKISDVSNATLEVPNSLENVLKGNKLFNLRLFGVEERDSLVTQYINEQLEIDASSIEYERRKNWNRALTEDIRLLVRNNSKLASKISKVPIAEKPHTNLDLKDSLIFQVKNNLGKLAVENAVLKQEISELLSQNSLGKHNYTQFHEDKAAQSSLKSQIMTNSELIEEKVAEWQSNLKKIDEQGDELINIVSGDEVYLNSFAKNTLSDKPNMNRFDESLLAQDTIISNQITNLSAEKPELFENIDKIIANNKEVSKGLAEIGKSESTLNDQVLSAEGLSRNSEEYGGLVQSISSLTKDISKNNELAANISDVSTLLAQSDSNELTKGLSQQIADEIKLEKSISDVILENALLKQKLVEEPGNMDSIVMKINANETIIAQQLDDLQETMEVIEQNTLEVEKFLSPQLYVEHALIRSNTSLQKFNNLLDKEDEINEDFLTRGAKEVDSEFVVLTQLNQRLNHKVSEVDQDYMDFNKKLADKVKDSDDLYTDGIAFMKENVQTLQSIADQISTDNEFTEDFIAQAEGFHINRANNYSDQEQSIVDISIKNARLKQEILLLINENSNERQRMLELDVFEGSYAVDQIIENTIKINKKITALENNISLIEQYHEGINEKIALAARVNNINIKQTKLNKNIEKALSLDASVFQLADQNSELEKQSEVTRLITGNGQLNGVLKSMNSEYLTLGQNMLDETNLGSSSDSLGILISSNMSGYLESIDTLIQNIQPFTDFDSIQYLSQVTKIVLLKQEITSHISQNTAFKMFLDSTNYSVQGEKFVKMVEFNTESIYEKVDKWTSLITQFQEDIATQSRLKSQIMANSEETETKIAERESNLKKIDEQGGGHTSTVSDSRVSLSSLAKNTLSDKLDMKPLEEFVLVEDTIISSQIAKLSAGNSELFENIDKIIANNGEVNKSLTEMGKSESILSDQVLSTEGLSRNSEEYEGLVQSISNLTKDISKNNELAATISDESILLAQNDSNELTKGLSQQIAEKIKLEENISSLILENALLKQKLVEDLVDMDSTVMKINANEATIAERFDELKETMEKIELNTFEVEKSLSPQLYVEHALIRSNTFLQKFNNLLGEENKTNDDFLTFSTTEGEMDSEFLALAQLNQELNTKVSDMNLDYMGFNQKLANELKGSEDLHSDGIVFMREHAQTLESIDDQINTNHGFLEDFIVKAEKSGVNQDDNYKQNIVAVTIKNARLKQEISSLINDNRENRQKMLELDILDASYAVDQIIDNTIEINKKILALEENMSLLKQYYKGIEERDDLESRIRNVNIKETTLNESIEKALSLDTEALQLLDQNSKLENQTDTASLFSGNYQLNSVLKSMNSEYLTLGQSMLDETNLGSSSSSLNLLISSSMTDYVESIDTVIQNIGSITRFDSVKYLSEIAKAALLKQEIASHINQNTAFKMFLDSTNFSVQAEEFVKMIEFNTESIHDKVKTWTSLIESIVDEHTLEDPSKTSSIQNEGYAVQVLAMPNGVDPLYSYLGKLDSSEIKIVKGKDGLERYYIGKYSNRREAGKAMRAIRAKGYTDAFIRPIIEYSIL